MVGGRRRGTMALETPLPCFGGEGRGEGVSGGRGRSKSGPAESIAAKIDGRKFAPPPASHSSVRQSQYSGVRMNERKSLPRQPPPQAASGRHTCTPSGGLRNSAHFPRVQNLTNRIPDQTLQPSDRAGLSSSLLVGLVGVPASAGEEAARWT